MTITAIRQLTLTKDLTQEEIIERITNLRKSIVKKFFLSVYKHAMSYGSVQLTSNVNPNGKVTVTLEAPEHIKERNKEKYLLDKVKDNNCVANYLLDSSVKLPFKWREECKRKNVL